MSSGSWRGWATQHTGPSEIDVTHWVKLWIGCLQVFTLPQCAQPGQNPMFDCWLRDGQRHDVVARCLSSTERISPEESY